MAKPKKSRKTAKKSTGRKSTARKSSGTRTITVPLRKYDMVMDAINNVGIELRDKQGALLPQPPDAGALRRLDRIRDPEARKIVSNLVKRNLQETYGISVTQAEMAMTQKKMARVIMDIIETLPLAAQKPILDDMNRRD